MKIPCTLSVGNRQLPSLAISSKQKYVKSTLALCKHPNSELFYIILFNGHNKAGTKYEVKGNISQILTRFIHEGKATIQFKAPQHDFFVQAEVVQLKGFLHLLRRVLQDNISPNELTCSTFSVTPIPAKSMPVDKLVIRRRSDYPAKGFPRTLEKLYINDIQRCSLDLGILQLHRLKLLDLSQNCIEFLPKGISDLSLKELNLASNKFSKSERHQWDWLGGNLANSLKLLNLSSNQLAYLPDQLVKLQQLTALNACNNHLTTLPGGIGTMQLLKIINVSSNAITLLPGSIRKCRFELLNISNNKFSLLRDFHPATTIPKTFPLCSLKELAGRRILNSSLPYAPGEIPLTLVKYLDDSNYCVCGAACFEKYIRAPEMLALNSISRDFIISNDELSFLPIDCYFCSLSCYKSSRFVRSRNPVI